MTSLRPHWQRKADFIFCSPNSVCFPKGDLTTEINSGEGVEGGNVVEEGTEIVENKMDKKLVVRSTSKSTQESRPSLILE